MRINNNEFQKNANTSLVAQLIWRTPGISRVDIARHLNLYRSTVTNIISSLIENKVVYEGEEGSAMSRGGRKPITLYLNDKFGVVAGFEIQPSHYRLVILDITGKTLFREQGKLAEKDFEAVIIHLMEIVLAQVEILQLPLIAVVVGIPGIVETDRGIIRYAEPFNVRDFDVCSFVRARYDVLVFVENDANCAAWLNLTVNRSSGLGDFLCMIADYHEDNDQFDDRAGIGVGIGLCLDGRVYHGSHHSSGEIRTLSWREGLDGQTGLPESLLIKTVDDSEAWAAFMVDLFSSLVPVISVLDPQVLFVHGNPFSDETKLMGLLDAACPQFNEVLKLVNCRLIIDTSDSNAVAKGAAMMFLQKLFAVPELSDYESKTHFEWEDVFKQVFPAKKNYVKLQQEELDG